MPASTTKIYIVLAAKYGLKSPVLYEFFPSGCTKFFKCRDATLEDELGALVDALTKHESELGPELLATAQDLKLRWGALYENGESAKGANDAANYAKKQARAALEMELFRNLLMLAQQFAGEPDKLDTFMQQSLLTRHRPKKAAKAIEA